MSETTKIGMDDRLRDIFRVQPLLEKVLSNRTETKLMRQILKAGRDAELNNLVNVEMDIVQTEMKMPDPKILPPIKDHRDIAIPKLDDKLKDHKNIMEGFKLL